MTAFDRVLELVRADGAAVLLTREHPELRSAIRRACAAGVLYRVLPGTFLEVDPRRSFELRAFALCRRYPDSVLTGVAAAMLSFWKPMPGEQSDPVTAISPRRFAPQPGYAVQRRWIPPELVVDCGAVRYTSPALTALEMCDDFGGAAIDTLLRSRRATLTDLALALAAIPGRRGNRLRRKLLLESRTEPWSAAERRAHKLLRKARITGWEANYLVVIAGYRYYLDIAFPAARLAVEIDGREFHDDPVAFENDRVRQNRLVLSGWRVLRLTWTMLRDDPDGCVEMIRQALKQQP